MPGPDLRAVDAALKNARLDRDRVDLFVTASQLGASGQTPERDLFRALSDDPTARVAVRGPAGAGKTSLLLFVLGVLRPPVVTIVLRVPVGQRDLTNDSMQASVAAMLAETLATAGNELVTTGNGVDIAALQGAAAKHSTTTIYDDDTTISATARPPFFSAGVTRSLKKQATALQGDVPAAQRRDALTATLSALKQAGARVLVVIDDTEHFAHGSDDEVAVAVGQLYRAVSDLTKLELQLALVIHPRFQELPSVDDVVSRNSFDVIDVAELPVDSKGIEPILTRRLEAAGITEPVREVFGAAAIAQLAALYHQGGRHDLRYVLNVAQRAARIADKADSGTIRSQHVNAALEATDKPS